ncbi:MAG: T9SS type A sorting domain-containing protein [Gemmatimonadetes bacterium]|nr:T9SS type A sorting domain-containing protein [Gemmatimonadota bacterium]MBT6144882.1 T9SS type A sorting domain-containing protein [Gemmatimonadota bacterium]MBT7861302.1 T9SS type A sorting domain-containing protein [Gemmatimonadota bacterium]
MDDNPGTVDQPLASLEGARQRVSQIREPGEPVTVLFAAGTYPFTRPVTFRAADSGSPSARITYRGIPGQEVRFSAGRQVTGWQEVTDLDVRRRLPAASLPHVRVAHLDSQGINDFGQLTTHGFAIGSLRAEAELFWNDEPMVLARWPNEGFRGATGLDGTRRVTVDTDRVAQWEDESDPWILAYWQFDWAEIFEPIVEIDGPNRVLLRSPDVELRFTIAPSKTRWYGYNLLSELDTPGEYYLDRESGLLYFWPPTAQGTAVLSMAEGLLRAQNLAHVTFRGITFEACRATAISVDGGEDIRIVGSTIRNTGHRGIDIEGGIEHEVYGCNIYHCGEGGISMSGGDRPTLVPAHHNAENNHVHHFSRRARTYKSAIAISGVGNRIAHNLIHDGPHMALSAKGNDHLVEYNEVHDVIYESGDAGAYYVGRDWTQRGTILRYNYWHDIAGSTGFGGMTIYLDDQLCGQTIHGNLFERTSYSVFIGGGDDNVVTNNVFIASRKAAHLDNRGMGWQKEQTDDENWSLRTRLHDMPYQNQLWSERYPHLPGILEDEPNIPKRNVFRGNISAGGRWNDINAETKHYQTIEDNLVFDDEPDWVTLHKDEDGRPLNLEFRDPEAVARIGFETLPVASMGLYQDDRRADASAATSVEGVHHETPESLELKPSYPNPFNADTLIPYVIPDDMDVEVSVYDLLGQRIKVLVRGPKAAGHHQVRWDGTDAARRNMASGVYLLRLRSPNFVQTAKTLLLR